MRTKAAYLLGATLVAVTGCVSLTPRAQAIQLYPADSPQLGACKKLGRVKAAVSGFSQLNWDNADEQARNDLRDAAAAKWGNEVDSVALVDINHSLTEATANGIGYRCIR